MIETLENQESALLMYLADELPAADRAQLAQRLTTDEVLRGQLESLRAVYDSTETYLSQLDTSPLPASVQASALRRVKRAMRQHLVERAAGVTAPAVAGPRLAGNRWAYPSAAAAAMLVAALGWWMTFGRTHSLPRGTQLTSTRPLRVSPSPEGAPASDANLKIANDIERVFSNSNDADSDLLALRDEHPMRLFGSDADAQ